MDVILQERLNVCKLSGMSKEFDRILNDSLKNGWTNLKFFEELMDEEIITRDNNRYLRLFKRAGFPLLKTIDQFKFAKAPFLSKKEIMEIVDGDFIDNFQNVIFIGSPGSGKTHIGISIGVEACRRGKTVLFYTAAQLGNKLVEMQDSLELSNFITKLKRVDLLLIDELGYVELSNTTTQLMFQIFSERYEKGSIFVSTNLEFQEWPKVFHNERMTAAILDRLIHNSKIVVFDGPSYRLDNHKEKILLKNKTS